MLGLFGQTSTATPVKATPVVQGKLVVDTDLAKCAKARSGDTSPTSTAAGSPSPARRRSNSVASFASSSGGASTRSSRSGASSQWSTPPVDYDILQSFGPNSWLTDASLTYSLSLIASNHVETPLETTESDLERVLGRRRALPKAVLLLDPASAFWLTLSAESPGDLERTRKSLQLEDRELILCPVNDCQMGCEGDAGTHWSLLVCMVSSGREGSQFHFVHYDSMRCASGRKSTSFLNAEALAGRLSGRPVVVEQASCAQQINGFDCGMYVLSFVSIILGVYMKTSGVQPEDWADRVAQISPQTVASLRKRFYEKVKASLD